MSSVDGRPFSISGTFGPPLGSSSTAFKYLRSQFKAIAPSVNPAAVGTVNDSIIITGAAKDFGGTPRVFAGGGGADIVNIFFDTATTDVDMGTILIPNPYPTWYSGISVNVGFNTPVNCGTGKTPAIFGSGSAVIDSLSRVLTQASGGGIAPTLPPVLNPQIAPTGTGTFVDLFHDRTGVGLNPTLQWTIQGGLALQPSYIRVFLNTVAPDATNTCVVTFSIAQLYTAGNVTSMTLPTGLLQNGVIYFATIRPTYEPARNILTKPFIRGSQEYFTETVTNTFTP